MTQAQLSAQRLLEHVVISVRGEIDLENAGRTRERIVHEIPTGNRGIVLDLSGVSHLDSAGVRLLFDLARRMRNRRLEFVVVAPSRSLLRDVLDVVLLDRAAAVVDTVDEALAELHGGRSDGGS